MVTRIGIQTSIWLALLFGPCSSHRNPWFSEFFFPRMLSPTQPFMTFAYAEWYQQAISKLLSFVALPDGISVNHFDFLSKSIASSCFLIVIINFIYFDSATRHFRTACACSDTIRKCWGRQWTTKTMISVARNEHSTQNRERELLAKSTSWHQNNCTESHSTAIFHSANICIECHEPSFNISVHSLPLLTINTRSSKEMDFLKIHYENLLYYLFHLFPFRQKTPQNIFGLSHNHHNGHLNQHIIHKTISFTFGRYWDDVQCSFKERFRCERFGDGRSVYVCGFEQVKVEPNHKRWRTDSTNNNLQLSKETRPNGMSLANICWSVTFPETFRFGFKKIIWFRTGFNSITFVLPVSTSFVRCFSTMVENWRWCPTRRTS